MADIAQSLGITQRELEILQLLVEGSTTREIATQLGISKSTVNVHRTNIMMRCRVHRTTDLVVFALANNLYEGDLISTMQAKAKLLQ